MKKSVDKPKTMQYNKSCVERERVKRKSGNLVYGVWLSLARAPGLGPGGRRFESCHPDVVRV